MEDMFEEVRRNINRKIKYTNWHIQNEDNRRQDKEREERTTMPQCLRWQLAPIAGHGTFTTRFVASADITGASLQSRWHRPSRFLNIYLL